MAAITAIIATTAAVVGAGTAIKGSIDSSNAQKKASKASAAQEAVRKDQLALDSARQRRQVSRTAAVQRANALAAGVAAGAQESSRIEGIQSSLTSQEGEQTGVISQAEELGFSIFNLNQQLSDARGDASTAGAIQNLGVLGLQNAQTIGNVGSTVYNNLPSTSSIGSTDASSTITNGLI
jgi:hypothetical protein